MRLRPPPCEARPRLAETRATKPDADPYTSRVRQNRRFGTHLVTTEAPGLATALKRPPVTVSLHLHRLNLELLNLHLTIPDEVSAIVLKAFASQVRSKDTDVVDIWRCLEIGFAADLDATSPRTNRPRPHRWCAPSLPTETGGEWLRSQPSSTFRFARLTSVSPESELS